MKNNPYKVDNGSSGFLSALGSGAIAVGSVATAIVVVVPGMPGYELISSGIEATGVGIVPLSNPSVDGTTPTEGEASVLSSGSTSVSVGPASTTSSLTPAPNSQTSDPSRHLPCLSGSYDSNDRYKDDFEKVIGYNFALSVRFLLP